MNGGGGVIVPECVPGSPNSDTLTDCLVGGGVRLTARRPSPGVKPSATRSTRPPAQPGRTSRGT